VYAFLVANNPAAIWRSERERDLLDKGMEALAVEQRAWFKRERMEWAKKSENMELK